MRTLFSVALLALVTLGSEVGSAQSIVTIKPSIFAGAAFPTGDNRNALNTGFTAGAGADLGALLLPIGLRADASYTQFGLKNNGSGSTGNSSDVSGRINAVLGIPSIVVSPYLIGGVGFYHIMTSVLAPVLNGGSLSGSSNKFGWNIGAGIDLPLIAFAGRLEARYHSVSTDGGRYTYLPVTVGIRF